MRTFVFSDLISFFTDNRHVAYCYEGSRRGTILLLEQDAYLFITPSGYEFIDEKTSSIKDYSNFELWGFIHEMVDEEYFVIRQEAVNRFFDVYCNMYNNIQMLQEYKFITE